jgi:regulator of protease activity HflC (stomatin/prohibitin superfamily)
VVFIVFAAVLAALVGIGVFIAPFFVDDTDEDAASQRLVIRVGSALVGFLLFAPLLFFSAWSPVPAGHVGVSYDIGDNIVGTRTEGDKFQKPWESTKTISVQRQVFRPDNKCSNGQDRCIETFSKDNQDVFVAGTLNYRINRENVETLMRDNPNYVDRSIVSRFNQIVKDETVKYTATELAVNREVIRTSVRDRLTAELSGTGIAVEDFLVDNITFKPEFQASIDRKVQAVQDAIAAQNKVAEVEAQAKQKAAEAEGEANRLRITAQGQADANALLNASLTPALIQFTAIQKLNDNINVMLLPSGGNFLIDPTKLAPTP